MKTTKPGHAAMKADPSLNKYFSGEEERRKVTRNMFDQAAPGYDAAERLTGLGSGPWYRKEVLMRNGLQRGMHILDVAAGTGLVTTAAREIVGAEGRVVALDPSPGMLAELRKKVDVEIIEGYAEDIPLPDGEVDFISMGYALRHVGDVDRAFSEYFRVLRDGGQVCLMEISRPESRVGRWVLTAYIRGIVPLLSRLLGYRDGIGRLWEYYGATINAAIDPDAMLAALRRAGFVDVRCSVTFGIFREYLATRPA